ncbi:MAG: monovalent cation/H+ antiporter complex subunit F [Verrucomicrobiia bacterium]
MIVSVTTGCLVLLVLATLAGLYRLARGPSVLDRILAFDMIAICAVAMMVILSVRWKTALFLELILIFSLLGFFGTVAFVFYLQKAYHPEEYEEPGDQESGRGGGE